MSNIGPVLGEKKENDIQDEVFDFVNMMVDALSIADRINMPNNIGEIDKVVIAGMGASGFSGKLIKSLLTNKDIIIDTTDSENIPAWVDEKTLLLAISYSGNTFETLAACEKAMEKKAKIIPVSSGGKLEEFSKANNLFFIKFNKKCQPRSAFPYLFVLPMKIFDRLGLFEFSNDDGKSLVEKVARIQNDYQSSDYMAEYVQFLIKGVPIFYSNGNLKLAGLRAKTQINENVKMFSHFEYLTESNHNAIEGLTSRFMEPAIIVFQSKYLTGNEAIQTNAFLEILKTNQLDFKIVSFESHDQIEEVVLAVLFSDYLSYHLATKLGINSTQIKNITAVKEAINKN